MKISNKVKMTFCFVLAILELMLVVAYADSGNSQAITTNLIIAVFLLYGGFQYRRQDKR